MRNDIIYTIVVTYNSMRWVEKCISSLVNSSQPTEIIVVDNASTDGTVEYIRENYPFVQLIEAGENLGFAKANNIGIRYALNHGADYVFLLNHDAWVEKETLSSLIDCMQIHGKVGIVSPIHLTGDKSQLDPKFSLFMPDKFHEDIDKRKQQIIYEIDFVNAAAWLMNVKMIHQIGGFDTMLFVHYGEDRNFCQRVHYFGWKIYVDTRTTICHDRFERVSNRDYRENIFQQTHAILEYKSKFGNINIRYNILRLMAKEALFGIGQVALLRFSKANKHIKRIPILYNINKSRKINKIGGLVWL